MLNRDICLRGVENCRDLGGIQTADGRRVIEGLMIRSADLSAASAEDVARLRDFYRLKKIVDLRTDLERAQKMDAPVDGAEYLPCPIFQESQLGISHEKGLGGMVGQVKIPPMESLYRLMAEDADCRAHLGRAMRTIMEHDYDRGGVLWHCTQGKDRCGLVSALTLLALGVDQGSVMEDYLLTNRVNETMARETYEKLRGAGVSEELAQSVLQAFVAREGYLRSAFDAMEEGWGSLENYFAAGLGVPEKAMISFRERVLK